ncbi:MAG: AMP-binding protein [Polyangiaceae bacterium]|nr:AMP-binding protein [Polyangiaceae bacterium]
MTSPAFPEEFNLSDYFLFDRLKEGRGAHTAIRFGEHALTYDEIAARALATSTVLRRAGLPRGGRVLVALRDVPAFAWAFFGALRAGGVVALGNPDADADTLAYLLRYTGASMLICPPRVALALSDRLGGVRAMAGNPGGSGALTRTFVVHEPATGEDPRQRCDGAELARLFDASDLETAIAAVDASKAPHVARTHRDEPAIWLFTSGSTGKPKAAMHAHRDFAFNTEVFAKGTVGLRASDTTVSVPRLFFGYATGTNLMFPFAVGATVGLFAERPTPESLIDAIQRYRPTVLTLVPTMMGKLLEHDEAERARGLPGLDLSRVRFSYSAGEALPGPLLTRFTARFPGEVYDGIGSAEMFHIYASNRPGDVKPGSLGKCVAGYTLKILPEDAEGPGAPEVPAGEIGVLWVRGESVALGYWLDRDKSFETFHGAWCRTGDLFHVDAEGYLYFDGRADDLLKVSGIFVAPLEVEECLLAHDAVAAVSVIGADDAGLTKPKAVVVPRDPAVLASRDAREALRAVLKAHVKDRLAKHKYPRFLVFVDDLPKNDRGKVDRKTLKAREAEGALPEEPA